MYNSNNSYKKTSLKIAHLNIQSISNKLDELKLFLIENSIDIMLINETFLTPSKKIKIKDYSIIRKDRKNRKGGGICFIIHDTIDHNQVNLLRTTDQDECLAFEFQKLGSCDHSLILAAYYSPPDKIINKYLLEEIFEISENVILLGDLNAQHQSWFSNKTNQSGSIIKDLINNLDLCLINDSSPTYVPIHKPLYSAIIDLVVATEKATNLITNFETVDTLRSDHVTVLITIKHEGLCNIGAPSMSFKNEINLKSISEEILIKELSYNTTLIEYPELISKEMVDSLVKQVTIAIQASVEVATLSRTIKVNQNKLLFLPKYIIELIKEKRKCRKRFYKSQNPTTKIEFNDLTSKIKNEIHKFKVNKWRNFCSSLNNFSVSDSKLWKAINSIDNSIKKLNYLLFSIKIRQS